MDWIDVEESLPEIGKVVLAYIPSYRPPRCYRVMTVVKGKKGLHFSDDRNSMLYLPITEEAAKANPGATRMVAKWLPFEVIAAPEANPEDKDPKATTIDIIVTTAQDTPVIQVSASAEAKDVDAIVRRRFGVQRGGLPHTWRGQ